MDCLAISQPFSVAGQWLRCFSSLSKSIWISCFCLRRLRCKNLSFHLLLWESQLLLLLGFQHAHKMEQWKQHLRCNIRAALEKKALSHSFLLNFIMNNLKGIHIKPQKLWTSCFTNLNIFNIFLSFFFLDSS